MLQCAYNLCDIINIWTEKFLSDSKIEAIQLKENEWLLILLVDNLLYSFYDLTVIVSRIINTDIHMRYQIYDALFNHINKIKSTVRDNECSSKQLVLKACALVLKKLSKYYSKMKDKDELIYNLVMIMNSTQKLNLNWEWNENDDDEHDYFNKYKKKFQDYFHHNYEERTMSSTVVAQRTEDVEQIM